ncbi:MAG: hypothetical protein H0V82_13145 [Candidatus Protochlamydia sp.]|nr:hypothetical protein [Candidatus Protochlamydia sp.]
MNSINHCVEKYFAENNSINTKHNILNDLHPELLTKIVNILEMNSLKNVNQASKRLNYFTDKNNEYLNEKTNQLYAKQIISEFQPFINIVPYYEGGRAFNILPNLEGDNIQRLINAKLDNKAQEQCEGKLVVQLDENTGVSIDFICSERRICKSPLKSFLFKNYFNGYKCQYTSAATVNNVFNDEKIEKAVTIAQQHINKLISANFKKARDLI